MSYRTNRKTKGIFLSRYHDYDYMKVHHFLKERAVYAVGRGRRYFRDNPNANGFTILHDDATGSVYDIDRPDDLATLHNVLPRELLYIIAKDNNKSVEEAFESAMSTPQELVDEFGSMPGFRVTTTGGFRYPDGHLGIDHGMLIASNRENALMIARRFGQMSILELDNRGDSLVIDFPQT